MVDDDDIVSEGAEYSPKSDFSKALVVQTQVTKCNELRSKEMRPGYTTHLVDKMGNVKIVLVPDARQEFIGAVEALKCTLYPEILREKGFKEIVEEITKAKTKLYNDFKYKEIKRGSDKDGKIALVFTGKEYLPKKGAIIVNGLVRSKSGTVVEQKIEGGWDDYLDIYWDKLLEEYETLYHQLHVLIDKCNYFKQAIGW